MARSSGNWNNANMPSQKRGETNERDTPIPFGRRLVEEDMGFKNLGKRVEIRGGVYSRETFEFLKRNNLLPSIHPNSNELTDEDIVFILTMLDREINGAQRTFDASKFAFVQSVQAKNVAPISNDPVEEDDDDPDLMILNYYLGVLKRNIPEGKLKQISDSGQTTTDHPQKVQIQAKVHQARSITPMAPANSKNSHAINTRSIKEEIIQELNEIFADCKKADPPAEASTSRSNEY